MDGGLRVDRAGGPEPAAGPRRLGRVEHFGIAGFNVAVTDVDAVDDSTDPPTQTAEVRVFAILGDHNLDNEWWATINFNLLCLGRP